MKHFHARNLVLCLLLAVCLTVFCTGCGAKTEHLALPFTADELVSAELFLQTDGESSLEKKVLKTQADLHTLWEEIDGLPIEKKENEPEPPQDSVDFSIRFILQDDTNWLLAYESLGVKAGHLYGSNSADCDHFTAADVAGIWNLFAVPVLPATPSEIPFAQ